MYSVFEYSRILLLSEPNSLSFEIDIIKSLIVSHMLWTLNVMNQV